MGEKNGKLVVSEIHICYKETMAGVCCEIHTSYTEKCMEGVCCKCDSNMLRRNVCKVLVVKEVHICYNERRMESVVNMFHFSYKETN